MASAESIRKETQKAVRDVLAGLKERGIVVQDIDGPSDEPNLRNLQDWQAVRSALETSAQVESPVAPAKDWSNALPASGDSGDKPKSKG